MTLHELLFGKKTTDNQVDLYEHINKVKENAAEWLEGIVKNGIQHSRQLENNLNLLMPDKFKEKLNSAEIFILLYSVYLHDIGYRLENGTIEATAHAGRTRDYITAKSDKYLFDRFSRMSNDHVKTADLVAQVCYGHASENICPLNDLPNNEGDAYLSAQDPINIRRLTALLRLADESDLTYIRDRVSPTVRDHISQAVIVTGKIIVKWTGDQKAGEEVNAAIIHTNQILIPVNECLSDWDGFPIIHFVQEPPCYLRESAKNHDNAVVNALLKQKTTLMRLETFITNARNTYLFITVLPDYEQFKSQTSSYGYYVNDIELKSLIEKFQEAWSGVLQYQDYFTQPNVSGLARPYKYHEVTADNVQELNNAIEEFPVAADKMDQCLRDLVAYARKHLDALK